MVPASCSWRDALLLARDDVAREHRQHRAVHRHRHRHAVERDAVEEDLHVLDRVDRDAGLADVADDARVVAVVAAVRREVERDRQAHLPGGEVLRGRTRSTPRRSRSPRTGGSSTAGSRTSSPGRPARTGRTRAARRRSRALRGRPRCTAAGTGMPSGVCQTSADGSAPRSSLAASSRQSSVSGASLVMPEIVLRGRSGLPAQS